jgi:acyl-[acyl-carrier-protein] desaturase
MTCYGALQEAATFVAYMQQKERAARAGDGVLESIFTHLSRDEAAHAGFYRTVLAYELEEDRQGTIADLAYVLANFRMPGDGLIPDYQQRLRVGGGGITPRQFTERAVLSTLRALGTTRSELRGALSSETSAPNAEAASGLGG